MRIDFRRLWNNLLNWIRNGLAIFTERSCNLVKREHLVKRIQAEAVTFIYILVIALMRLVNRSETDASGYPRIVSLQLHRNRINRGTCLVIRARNNRGKTIWRVARRAYLTSWRNFIHREISPVCSIAEYFQVPSSTASRLRTRIFPQRHNIAIIKLNSNF